MEQHESPVSGLATVVCAGDYRASLLAVRDGLAQQIDDCDSKRDYVALSRQLTEVLAAIEAVPDKAEVSAADEVAKRRAKRRAGSDRQARAKRSG